MDTQPSAERYSIGGRVLLVGGHSRNIGKTTLAADLIRSLPDAAWTAVRITQYGHNICSVDGHRCDCAPAEHAFSLDEERNSANRTDSSRFLSAGAARSLWLRTKQGFLEQALPLLLEQLEGAENIIIESNTLRRFLRPQLYLMVLEPLRSDFKDSARRLLSCADAFLLRSPLGQVNWPGVPRDAIEAKPCFFQPIGAPVPPGLVEFVRAGMWPRVIKA